MKIANNGFDRLCGSHRFSARQLAQQATTGKGTVTTIDRIQGKIGIRQSQAARSAPIASGLPSSSSCRAARWMTLHAGDQDHILRQRSGWGEDDHENRETIGRPDLLRGRDDARRERASLGVSLDVVPLRPGRQRHPAFGGVDRRGPQAVRGLAAMQRLADFADGEERARSRLLDFQRLLRHCPEPARPGRSASPTRWPPARVRPPSAPRSLCGFFGIGHGRRWAPPPHPSITSSTFGGDIGRL